MSAGLACNYSSSHQLVMSSGVETSLIVTSKRFLDFARNDRNGTIHHCRSCISPAQKNRDAVLSAPLFRRIILRFLLFLWAYDRVVSEVQIVRSSAIEVDPTLDHFAVSRIETHRQRGRTVGRHGHTRRDGDPAIASAQGPSIVNAGDSAPERIRGELRRRDAERLVAASGVV